jgi:hypothetical protein
MGCNRRVPKLFFDGSLGIEIPWLAEVRRLKQHPVQVRPYVTLVVSLAAINRPRIYRDIV